VDVNIDEVALGGDSGWGVVIKNVELREGAVLFSFLLPQEKNTPTESSPEKSTTSDEQSESKGSLKQSEVQKVDFQTKLNSIETIDEDQAKRDIASGKSLEGKKRTHLQVNGEKYFRDKNPSDDVIPEKVLPPSTPQSPFWFYRKAHKEENKDSQRRPSISSETEHFKNASSNNETLNVDDDQNENQNKKNEEQAPIPQMLEFRVGRGGKIGNLGVRYGKTIEKKDTYLL